MKSRQACAANLALERAAIDREWRQWAAEPLPPSVITTLRASLDSRHAAHIAYVMAHVTTLSREELAMYSDPAARKAAAFPGALPSESVHFTLWDLGVLAELASRDTRVATFLPQAVAATRQRMQSRQACDPAH